MPSARLKEMYIKVIFQLSQQSGSVRAIDIARRMHVSKASVHRAVKHLDKEGYIDHAPYGHISLTLIGIKTGLELCARQETVAAYLMATLSIGRDAAEEEACRLEHVVSHESIEKMREHLRACRYRRRCE